VKQQAYDKNPYANRNKVERFFGRLKEVRDIATCYDKIAIFSLAVAYLLAALNWLR
jgi:transposase